MLKFLENQLIVSCQPCTGGPMDRPSIVAALACAAVEGGATAVRVEGIRNVEAVRAACDAPIIGIVKVDLADSPVRITPFTQNIRDLTAAGSDIIALDVTDRPRPERLEDLFQAIKFCGVLSMADCSCLADGEGALRFGADILATTMAGYTTPHTAPEPDLELVVKLAALGRFVIAEGRYNTPALAAAALAAGANAVVVGSAITRTEVVTGWFASAVKAGAKL
ncbi:N-acetylmannosamine-6-phosphate 2-epimerase [Parasedimentitalea psychrophila]|uniref:Putative N-acetylmannosamine-6-phosphate 2-epimerase n=1 Tax=Parasedimentitalea psychrophila TaxID=2997337 RepID=A0A9Y2KYX7_9RHOB|nr:putative N-acetylmannosamine-6-phosphate 2-epimerase [Parasedimentitalea psychrophila]WIY24576.1 putative N-acetylmannosamine-6-phosphate 2-epimerase [Parasedimentitalea psychrophila]